ncbi:Histone acetyltransferase ESA1 [Leucoagaricus sp. SymC.cos]|nr:Histone acetyltransferase ESA1 [Leucoagaricus sp. SymC.cos]
MVSQPTPAPDAPLPPITPGGTYTIQVCLTPVNLHRDSSRALTDQTVSVGCKLYIRRPGLAKPEDNLEFFVHWEHFNKRLDEWVTGSRLVLSRDLEWPRPKTQAGKKNTPVPSKAPRGQNLLKKATSNAAKAASPTPAPSTPNVEPQPLAHFSKEQEIEKLRTSGSMTQSISEITRVKNLNRLQIGKHEVEAWYFSPYPKEYAHLPVLYICEYCLSFFPSQFMFSRHRKRCTMLHPPGNEIYRHEDISFYEIDGKRQLTWCRNLSLLSKCFLDHKTLYYDVTPFMYYVMAKRDSAGCHVIGYFSKEKESAENYNVACILTLPHHQRHGYGKLLIEFSYELSKKENKLGSPEKPLSDLGLLSYRAYWAETIVDLLLNTPEGELSIDEIAQKTSITHADVMNTCTTLQLFKHYKGQHMICLNNAVLEKHQKAMAKRRRRIHPEHLKWRPPVFTREQLRFGW